MCWHQKLVCFALFPVLQWNGNGFPVPELCHAVWFNTGLGKDVGLDVTTKTPRPLLALTPP